MGALVDGFGGKISGELIRANDWNGLLAAIEALVDGVEQTLDLRVTSLENATNALDARLTAVEGQLTDLVNVAATLRARHRRLNLATGTSRFALGQRGEITATVTSFDGTPLDLSNTAARPWVDFVATWGTLLPAAGFTARAGQGGRAVSVQVNASGQARVTLQADHAHNFSEAEHAQIESALATQVVSSGQQMSIADAILVGPTPGSVNVTPAFKAMTLAYSNNGSSTVRRYLDSYYVQAPSHVTPEIGTIVNTSWTDYLSTVFAFVKPDADPVSPDGAMGSASLQVTFRDWVTPWIVGEFFGDLTAPMLEYREFIPGLIKDELKSSVEDVLDQIENRARGIGILGGQRQFEAANLALRGLNVNNPAPFFGDAVDALVDGIAVQRAVSFGQAVTPGGEAGSATARAVAGSTLKSTGEATRVGSKLEQQFTKALGDATQNLRDQVKADNQIFKAELLRDDGPIAGAQKEAKDVRGALDNLSRTVDAKADLQFVTDFVRERG